MNKDTVNETDTRLYSSAPAALTPLPLGAVRPTGWLLRQLQVQADGLTGHLDEFWPPIADSGWIGGQGEGWERGPYWLDGLIPLAVLLDDARLRAKVTRWLDYVLDHQHADGWLGPKNDPHAGSGQTFLDPWPTFVLLKAMTQWQEATGDPRIIPAMRRVLRRIDALLDERPLQDWAAMRWPDLAVSLEWLFARTGEEWLWVLRRKVQAQGYDWHAHFRDFRYTDKQTEWTLENHVVNTAMALKAPAIQLPPGGTGGSEASGGEVARHWIAVLDRFHGQVSGVFSGDESLAGRSPTQGTETCAVVEYMYSLELLLSAFGDADFGDRLERIAYNALPAAFTPDMWAHQYDQQANQALCPDAPRAWTNNDATSNLFGLEPHFGCCTANMHQGWPKFAAHLWMATPDGGLAAVAYGPCATTAAVGKDDREVTVTEDTEYPFREQIGLTLSMERAVRFPLRLRIPAWAAGATVQVGREAPQAAQAGAFHTLSRLWEPGDRITLTLPMLVRLEPRDHAALSVLRGPLVFALKIGEEFRHLRGERPHADYEVHPTTPWNYGLALGGQADTAFTCREAPLGPRPFDPEQAPVTLTAPARILPQWTLEQNSAGPLPPSPVTSREPLERIVLIPYGSAHLRVSEFPEIYEEDGG